MTSARVVKDFYQWFSKALSSKKLFLFSEVQFRLNSTKLSPTEVPSSVCSLPCPEGQMKKYDEGESCCWTCHECIAYQVSFKANQLWTIQFFLTDDIICLYQIINRLLIQINNIFRFLILKTRLDAENVRMEHFLMQIKRNASTCQKSIWR